MDLSIYSKYRPKVKMITKIVDKIIIVKLKKGYIIIIKGIRRAISISKIKKIMVIKKNWILNGRRLNDKGSNPHSKGDDFSILLIDFFEIIEFINKSNGGIIIIIIKVVIKIDIIIYNFHWEYFFN